MTDGVSLRPSVAEDREFLFDLHKASMGPYVEELFGPWDDAVQWGFFDRWFHPEDVFVITVEDEDVGVLGLENGGDEVYVTRIEVHPEWQNQGVGTAVMQQVLGQAGEEGRAVSLHVFRINPARSLYRRLGFIASDEHEDRILMELKPR